MAEKLACVKCGRPLEKPATGRPPAYCSTACRRLAEYELRRINRRLEKLEGRASRLRHSPDVGAKDWAGRTHAEALAACEAEIADAEKRLRALLDAAESLPETRH
jgi:sugar-specific transcriptional regulator TrmB